MQLIISGRRVVLTKGFKDVVTGKVATLAPLLPTLIEARATFTAAVDEAVAGLAHQVRRAKDRRRLAGRRRARVALRRPAGEVA